MTMYMTRKRTECIAELQDDVLERIGGQAPSRQYLSYGNHERNAAIVRAYRDGVPTVMLAQEHGLSRTRIDYMIDQYLAYARRLKNGKKPFRRPR